MSVIQQCDGGCGQLIDAVNEDFDVEPTTVIDDIIDPFTGEQWSQFYCRACADRLFPDWSSWDHRAKAEAADRFLESLGDWPCCHRCICCNRDDWPCCECGGLHE